MSSLSSPSVDYGNWVSTRLVYVPGALALLLGGLSLRFPLLVIPAAVLLVSAVYFAYARQQFSPTGGDVQSRIVEQLLAHVQWSGEGTALDVGCGSGRIAIRVARQYPQARVIGVDAWGGHWEYSKVQCENNAHMEGVADRTVFQRASAASLPFEDGAFDVVVSNLSFHEANDLKDKRDGIRESLRVLHKGGSFAFQDLFLWKQVFGDLDDLLEAIRSWGVDAVEFIDTSRLSFIPKALKLPFMVGTIGILRGRK